MAAILSVMESCRRMGVPVREYLRLPRRPRPQRQRQPGLYLASPLPPRTPAKQQLLQTQDEFPDLRKRYWDNTWGRAETFARPWARWMSRRSASTLRTRSETRTTKGSRSPRPRSLEPALSREALQAASAAPRDFQSQLNPTALRLWLFRLHYARVPFQVVMLKSLP